MTHLQQRTSPAVSSRLHLLSQTAQALSLSGLLAASAFAQDAPGIVGKNDWLYYKYELTSGLEPAAISTSVDLVQRINRQLQKNGVAVVVAMVPLKVRVHPENLPSSVKMTESLQSQYGRIMKSLNEKGVLTADLNTAFVGSPKRIDPMPLFFKQDTHWSAAGALVAAETIRDAINAQAPLKAAFDATTPAVYKLTWATQEPLKQGDLVAQLPKGSPSFPGEPVKYFEVDKVAGTEAASLTGGSTVGTTLLGSSYTHEWTKFPGAISFILQRDILSISVDASQGQWVGLHTYLRDDAFQTNKPKLMIWEMPERDMSAPPQYKWRDARYSMDNTEWLLQASALVQQQCEPASIKGKVDATGLGAGQPGPNATAAKASGDQDFVDISFDKPLDAGQYLSARVLSAGSKALTIEATGAGMPARKLVSPVAGDDAEHNLRLALAPGKGKGYTKLRVFPGATTNFSLKELQVCNQPRDL